MKCHLLLTRTRGCPMAEETKKDEDAEKLSEAPAGDTVAAGTAHADAATEGGSVKMADDDETGLDPVEALIADQHGGGSSHSAIADTTPASKLFAPPRSNCRRFLASPTALWPASPSDSTVLMASANDDALARS